MISALRLKPSDEVCEIGTGTGYCTALLAQLAKEVVSLERFQTLALEASARIKAFGLANVAVLWTDAFDFHGRGRRFDKVIAHGLIEPPAREFLNLLKPGGALVAAFAGPGRGEQRIVGLTAGDEGPDPCRRVRAGAGPEAARARRFPRLISAIRRAKRAVGPSERP